MRGSWTTNDGRYEFRFVVKPETSIEYAVSIELYFIEKSGIERFMWSKAPFPYDVQHPLVDLPTINDYSAHGWLKLSIQEQTQGPHLVVFAELTFTHLDNQKEFQGPIFVQGISERFPVPPEEPVVPAPDPIGIDPIHISSDPDPNDNPLLITPDDYDDLFPYIFMKSWPQLSLQELKYSLASYHPTYSSPPNYQFYQTLVSLNNQGKHQEIIEKTDLFLEGLPPYEGMRVYRQGLSGPIKWFEAIYQEIQLLEAPVHEDLISLTGSFLPTSVTGPPQDQLLNYFTSQEYLQQKEAIWQTYFALIIRLGYEHRWLDQLTRILLCCHILETLVIPQSPPIEQLPKSLLWDLIHSSILLPNELFPLTPRPQSPPNDHSPLSITPYAIGDLHQVQQTFLRYDTGEIAQLVNIMPGEKKEVVSRKLKSTQVIDKDSTQHIEASTDESQEQISNFEAEVWESLIQSSEVYDYADLKNSYGPPTNITLNGKWTKKLSLDSPGQEKLTDFAKEVLTKSSKRVSQQIKKYRQSNALNEDEETITSTFDNIGNAEPICGSYRWLNKIFEAQVVKYGERLILSFSLINPAKSYVEKTQQQDGDNYEKPKTLAEFGIQDFQDITPQNYVSLTAYYQLVDFPLPPQESLLVSETLIGTQSKLVNIPEGYEATEAYITYILPQAGNVTVLDGVVGRTSFHFDHPASASQSIQLNRENTAVPVSVNSTSQLASPPESIGDVQLSVEINTTYSEETLNLWKIEIYKALKAAYDSISDKYHRHLDRNSGKINFAANPLKIKKIVKEELKKGCMNTLLEILSSFGHQLNSPPRANSPLPRDYEFITNAFEWDEMTFFFQEDYSTVDTVGNLYSTDDQLFSAFTQAKSAQIIIPVRRLDSYRMLYFLKTGDIWIGEDRLAPAFKDNASMVYQLTEAWHETYSVPEILDTWEVVIPTTLQVLEMNKEWGGKQNIDSSESAINSSL